MAEVASRGARDFDKEHREDPLWYKDAIIYQLHVKAFFDLDNDGMGDFKGLTERLDYIKDLGVTAVWLMPFYPSPMRDGGYDISEYKNVHPDYGTSRDFRAFVRKAHTLGLKVITELVINHTSDEHPWFRRARGAPKGSARRNFYVWSDTPDKYEGTRVIFTDTERSNWTWDEEAGQFYWHRFFSHQPDLNHDNPQVFKAMMRVMRFWLDAGVDGMRLDAIPYLIEREGTDNENLPETHEVLKKMRAQMDARYKDRLFLAEANQWPEDVLPYFGEGDECHMAFHFPLMPRIFMALAQEDRHPIVEIMRQTPEIPEGCQWAIFLRNHDELTLEMVTDRERDYMYQTYATDPRMRVNAGIRRRLAPMMENDRSRIELLNSLLLSMPGTPIIYYGDELGMGDNIFLGDRDAVRTPMQWTGDRNAGFSRTEPARLYLPPIMDPVYGYEAVNVEAHGRSAGSLLNWMKRIIAVRKVHRAFGRGTLEFLHPGNRKVIAYLREHEDDTLLCVANLSRSAQPVELDLSRFRGLVPVELLGNSSFPPLGDPPYLLTLPGYGFYWFRLAREAVAPRWHQESPRYAEPPVLVLPAGHETDHEVDGVPIRLHPRQLAQLEREALPNFLNTRRWFTANRSGIERVEVVAQAELASNGIMIVLRVHPAAETPGETEPQLYFLPLVVAWDAGEDGDPVSTAHVLTKLRRRARMGFLLDALADERFCRNVVETMGNGSEISAGEGSICFSATRAFGELAGDEPVAELGVRRAEVERANSSVILGERLVLKAYRHLQKGTNPGLEVGRYLTEEVLFENTPPLAGAAVYRVPDGDEIVLGLLQGFVENQGDGWAYVLNYLQRYLEDHLLTGWSPEGEDGAETKLGEPAVEDPFFTGLVRTLGLRTGELHAAFARPTDDEAFAPEPAPPGEVAGWAEGVLAEVGLTLDELESGKNRLPDKAGSDADRLLALRPALASRVEGAVSESFGAVKTRYHGDYHLGRVLVVGNDFQIVDFEGDPARPVAERREKHSPLRDVAGMLCSFNYAIRSALMDLGAERADDLEGLEPWVGPWEEHVRRAFLDGYTEGADGAVSYPENEGHARALVELFAMEKVLHDIRRELDDRPDRAGIPIKGVLDLLGVDAEGEQAGPSATEAQWGA